MPDSKAISDIIVVGLVAAKAVYDVFGGRRRDRRHMNTDIAQERRFNGISTEITAVRAEVAEVRSFCVGPDGTNGIRGDLREVKKRVIDLEERERQRLEARQVGTYDRRST